MTMANFWEKIEMQLFRYIYIYINIYIYILFSPALEHVPWRSACRISIESSPPGVFFDEMKQRAKCQILSTPT